MGQTLVQNLGDPSTPLEKFAQKVLKKLIEENTPPIPYYYRIYFLNMLDEEPADFRKQVYELIAVEESSEEEKDLELEKKIKLSFKYSKEMLQHTAQIYKTTASVKELIKKHIEEILNSASQKAVEKLLKQLIHRIETINQKMDHELQVIKNLYSKNIEIIKEVESNSMFDQKYGVYNKKYFIKILKKEIDLIEKFSHTSSIITIKIKDSVLSNFNEKSKILANRSVSKIILKTSRRTDVIAYLGDGVFAMLLKHTDRIGAEKTVERLADMVSMSAIFLEGEEVELAIVAGIVEIRKKKDPEEYIQHAIQVMHEAEKEDMLYKVYEEE